MAVAIEDRFSKTNHVLHQMTLDCSADHIHSFRVEIKKLKALIRLFSFSIPDPSTCKFPKPLDTLYKSLGSLREWQIQKQNIAKTAEEMHYANQLAYLDIINRKTDSCKRRVMELMGRLPDLKRFMEQIKNNSPGELTPDSIDEFIQMKMLAVQNVLQSGKYDDASMHDMRKKVKDVQYIISGSEKAGRTNEHIARLKSVQYVSAKLGDYHDLCIALILLKKELNKLHKDTDEKKLLRKIKNKWQADKLSLRQRTTDSLQVLIQHHFPEACVNGIA